jgi:hypothetical protein
MTALREIEKHVLDDAIELIASVGLGNPLMHTTVLYGMKGDEQRVALFLRGLLGRHVVLIVTRLHAPKGVGKTGETASIDSYLHYAEAEASLSATQAAAFRSNRQAIIVKLEAAGIKFSELLSFRHAELAHSLHCPTPLANKLLSLPIWDFASDTFELVRAIEKVVSGTGRLGNEFQDWLDRGNAFWPESEMPNIVSFETASSPD